MRSNLSLKLIVILCLLTCTGGIGLLYVHAQAINQWSSPALIPDFTNSRPPILIADQNKTVHAFYDMPLDNLTDGFYYREWSLDQGWTQPVDFLLTLRTVPSPVQSVFLDKSGIVHLVYFGDLQENGNIYYTQAPITEADNATAWQKPYIIGPAAGPVVAATIFGDGVGTLIVLYSGQEDGVGLYEVHSDDGGLTWSDTTIVSLIEQKNNWPYSIRLALDSYGDFHAVWSLVNDVGVGTAIYYSRLESGQTEWTEPILMAKRDPGDYSTTWPEMVVNGDELILVYQDSFPATKFMRLSKDLGRTWSDPVRPFPHIGEYENPIIVRDGDGVLHMFLGNRIGDPGTHGMWHSIWLGDGWSDLTPIVSGPRTNTFDPSAPQAVVSQGNVILVAWWNNVVDAGPATYSYTVLNTHELPIVPNPTPTLTPADTPIATPITGTATPAATLRPLLNSPSNSSGANGSGNPAMPVYIGLIPVVLLLFTLVVIQRNRHNLPR
jgi:hypothetical protein